MSINSLPALYWYLLNWINTILVFRYYSQIVKCATFLKSLNARSACKRKITPICIFTKLPGDSAAIRFCKITFIFFYSVLDCFAMNKYSCIISTKCFKYLWTLDFVGECMATLLRKAKCLAWMLRGCSI